MSFAITARMSLRSPASCATETTFQSRYPAGISVTKTGAAVWAARRDADANVTTLTRTVAVSRKNVIRFMSASGTIEPAARRSIHWTKVSTAHEPLHRGAEDRPDQARRARPD